MGLLDLFFTKTEPEPSNDFTEKGSSSSLRAFHHAIYEFAHRFGIPKDDNLNHFVRYYSENSIVYALMDWKAKKSAQVTPNLFKTLNKSDAKEYAKWNGKYTEAYEYRKLNELKKTAFEEILIRDIEITSEYWKLKKLLTKPNDFMTFGELMYAISAFKDAAGFSAIWGQRIRSGLNPGKSESWHVMPSHRVNILTDNSIKPVSGYSFDFTNLKEFRAADVCLNKSFSMDYDGSGRHLYGTSKVKVGLSEVLSYVEASNREYYGFKSGDTASVLFPKHSENLPSSLKSSTGIQSFKDSILKALRQKDRHKAAIVNVALDSIKLDSQLKESITLEAKKEIRQVLASVWGLSNRVVLNSAEGSSFNNVREEIKTSLRDGVFPDLITLCENLNEFEIQRNYKGVELHFDYDNFPEFTEDRKTAMKSLKDADYMSDNQKLFELGYEPIADERANLPEKYWPKDKPETVSQ